MIFVHGGGFKNGDKGEGHDLSRYLSKKGIITATINYSLYMKGRTFGCDEDLDEKVKAIQIAVNQLWLATDFFIKNAQDFKIDTSKIFISGSSAGAETVLHAAFWDRNLMDMYGHNLPKDFKYQGLVSGAGALMDINLVSKRSIIPVMFFHGNGDELVPYGTASHHYCPTGSPGWLMLFGAYPLYQRACELGGHSVLYTFCGGGHENANTYYHGNMKPIYRFIQDVLEEKKIAGAFYNSNREK